jgi:hypothetical protein
VARSKLRDDGGTHAAFEMEVQFGFGERKDVLGEGIFRHSKNFKRDFSHPQIDRFQTESEKQIRRLVPFEMTNSDYPI